MNLWPFFFWVFLPLAAMIAVTLALRCGWERWRHARQQERRQMGVQEREARASSPGTPLEQAVGSMVGDARERAGSFFRAAAQIRHRLR